MKTKKVLENNSDNSCDISDVSSCDISGNESDTGLTIVANEEKPMKNKKKVTTEELRKVIEKSLASSDDEKPIKNKKKVFTKKSKKVVENSDSSTSSGDDKDHKKPTKPIKNKKKLNTKDAPKKTLVEGDDFKKRQRKAKKLGVKTLDCSKRKNNKYVVEYEGKKIHFGSTKYDYLIHKGKERRDKYLAKAKKITNKNGDFTYDSPSFPNYWSVKLLN